MKKIFITTIIFIGCTLSLFSESWEKIINTDKYGETSVITYIQTQRGEDEKNIYGCGFGVARDVKKAGENVFMVMLSTRKGDKYNLPYSLLINKNVTIEIGKYDYYRTFKGTIIHNDDKDIDAMIVISEESIFELVNLLQSNDSWDCFIRGDNLNIKTTIDGNLPFSFNIEDILVISKDTKKVIQVKKWAKDGIDSIEIPNSVEEIESRCFADCKKLKSVIIPDTVKKIGSYAFSHCYSLDSISFPNSVNLIGEGAFSNCETLRKVILSESLKKISAGCFWNCKALKDIIIPKNVERIYFGAFLDCAGLESVTIKNDSLEMDNDTFEGCNQLKVIQSKRYKKEKAYFVKDDKIIYVIDTNLENYTIPNTIKMDKIDFEELFQKCKSIKTIEIPKNIKITRVPTTVQIIRK